MNQPERRLNPNPELSAEQLNGSQMDEPFFRLNAHEIDSLTIDGHRLVSVDDVIPNPSNRTTSVVCTADDGSTHLFRYNPWADSPVEHHLVTKPAN